MERCGALLYDLIFPDLNKTLHDVPLGKKEGSIWYQIKCSGCSLGEYPLYQPTNQHLKGHPSMEFHCFAHE